ncbi:MAG TPA: immunoglobulin domain-containing protein, partial [Candidatus Acidoferrum sp.]|nr:immunoglobulin domain-containing protein [Candidatus Acidoferrum sp.]
VSACLALIAFNVVLLAGCNGVVHTTTTPNGNGSGDPSAPMITTQPISQTVGVGQSASFVVIATGSAPLSYQWQKNGANIAGATSTSYTTPAATTGDNAAKFSVVVSNSAGSVASNVATLTVTAAQGSGAPQITTQPESQSVTAGQMATFTVVATGSPTLTYQWQKNHANITGATSSSYTTPATATSDSGETFDVVVSNSIGSVTSVSASLTVNAPGSTPPGGSTADVTTYHYDNLRTGQNTHETILTHAKVNSSTFGLLGAIPVDGHVDAQPLYLSNVAIPGQGNKNVLYVVTEHDSVYAFDADSVSGSSATTLWHSSMLAAGETSSDDRNCGQVSPEIGITSTPVIDRTRNAIYLVAVSKTSGGNYIHRFHALDLTTGHELFGGPTTITATYPGSGANSSNGNVVFDPKQYNERPGLLQVGGTIFTTWGSHCDAGPYTSWVMSYSADTLHQTGVIDLVPNGNEGGIWMAGAAPGADASGIYFIIGNGEFGTSLDSNGFPVNKNCGNCFAKISSTTPLALKDYFTPSNTVAESASDTDFGSGGPLLLPDVTDSNGQTRHLAVGAGKDSIIYVVDRDKMGKFNSSNDNIYQKISGALSGGVWSKPSYFNGVVYYGAVGDSIKAFPISGGKLATTSSSHSSRTFGYPGATPVISANGTTDGIVWVVENGGTGVLHAYDAGNLATELYNSTQSSNAQFSGNKFITPIVINGRVYVGTQTSVVVFGLK